MAWCFHPEPGPPDPKEIIISKRTNRGVYRGSDGTWVNQRDGAERASSLHHTQADAIITARDQLHRQGGGELTDHGRGGKIRSKHTIPSGNDPNPPRDREH